MIELPQSYPNFYQKAKDAKVITVIDLGMLGDGVHLLPVLWSLKCHYPNAILNLVMDQTSLSLFKICPWIDNVIGYSRFSKRNRLWQDIQWVKKLRALKSDVTFNFSGSQRSGIFTMISGSKLQLGRIHPKKRKGWKWYYTHPMWMESAKEPIFKLRLHMLKNAAYPEINKKMPLKLPQKPTLKNDKPYIHISPFATSDYKELPDDLKIQWFSHCIEKYKDHQWVFSCAPSDRETHKMKALIEKLPHQPDCVFSGNLSLGELASLISNASVHLGGDSGAMHLAWLCSTPTLTWFRPYDGKIEWEPRGYGRISITGNSFDDNGINGITMSELNTALDSLLQINEGEPMVPVDITTIT
jgi:ADP-heptose:LPS heptosyltransferase